MIFRDYLNNQPENEEFRAEFEALEPEYAIIQAMIDARKLRGITQKEFAERTGIARGDISRPENGGGNPSLRTLERLAAEPDMRLKLSFEPLNS